MTVLNPEPRTAYEQLSVEAAARIDSVCDRFEKDWRAARSGAVQPDPADFLEGCVEPERTVLMGELIALDRACRARYGLPEWSDDSASLGAETSANAAADRRRHGAVPGVRSAGWVSIPGLEMVEFLGSGGMGMVFKARQVTLHRDVAVKFLRDDHRADPGRRERFLLHARGLSSSLRQSRPDAERDQDARTPQSVQRLLRDTGGGMGSGVCAGCSPDRRRLGPLPQDQGAERQGYGRGARPRQEEVTMRDYTISDFRRDMRYGPYAWPGGSRR